MKYLLDTCVVSEFTRPAPNQRILEWMRSRDEDSMFLSVLTVGELQKGIAKLSDMRRRDKLQQWLDTDLRARFSERLLPVNEEVALTWGNLEGDTQRRGLSVSTIDGLLGATAIVHNLTVVTRDEGDISRTGARVLNPWT